MVSPFVAGQILTAAQLNTAFAEVNALDAIISAIVGGSSSNATLPLIGAEIFPLSLGGDLLQANATALATFATQVFAGFTQVGAGAIGRPILSKLLDFPLNPKDFGATGNGTTDDTLAINICISVAVVLGTSVGFTDGTYLLATPQGANNVFIPAPSNVTIFALGGAVTLKAGAGLNTTRPYGWNFIFPATTTNVVTNLTVRGLTFDHNGANNLPTAGQTPKNAAVGAEYGSNILVENCVSINNAGEQCFTFGTAVAGVPTASNIIVRHIRVSNVAGAIAGNIIPDHSSIFMMANGYTINDIIGYNATNSGGTFVEFHGSNGRVFDLNCTNYGGVANHCAEVCNTVNTVMGPNIVGNGVQVGVTYWCQPGFTLAGQMVGPCDFFLNYYTGHSFDAKTNIASGAIFSLEWDGDINCVYQGGPNLVNIPQGLYVELFNRLTINGAHFEGFMGNGIYAPYPASTGGTIDIRNATFKNCNQTTLSSAYNSAVTLGTNGAVLSSVVMRQNRATACGSYLYGVLGDSVGSITQFYDDGNSIDSTMLDISNVGATPAFGANNCFVRHVSNRSPAGVTRASAGSEQIDLTTGNIWKKTTTGETSSGWSLISGMAYQSPSAVALTGGSISGIYTGSVQLGGNLTLAYASASYYVNDSSGTGSASVRFQSNGVNTWNLQASSGGFSLNRYVSGVLTDSPIQLSPTTGRVTMVGGVSSGSYIDVTVAGQGLRIAEGSNAKQGTATLTAGAVTVANTSVTANSRIVLTGNADGGTPGWVRVSARTAGTSFTITSSSATDTSTVAYQIFEPG